MLPRPALYLAAARLLAMLGLVVTMLGAMPCAALTSPFLQGDVNAAQVMSGTPYDMSLPPWRISANDASIDRSSFAYKLFSGLLMLGYQGEMGANYGMSDQHLRALHRFQANNALPVSNLVDAACLTAMDTQLTVREQMLAPIALTFPLYNDMQPLHPHDVSKDTVAAIYALPMNVLPAYLQMSTFELVQCIVAQCVGFMLDGAGNAPNFVSYITSVWLNPPYTTYKFVGAYFDPLESASRQLGAELDVITLLHEYAHYLDGTYGRARADRLLNPQLPHWGLIDTTGFYDIGYVLSSETNGCFVRKSNDPQDWMTRYGFLGGSPGCAANTFPPVEDFADSFAYYVGSGRDFRAAANQRTMLAQRYAWLKDNVFQGIEFDTDLPGDMSSGCNDIYGTAGRQPGYTHCNDNYVWNFTLPHGRVDGACGTAQGAGWSTPVANLCGAGAPSNVAGSGPWNWSCGGMNGGGSASCAASLAATPSAPQSVTAVAGNAQASVSFAAPAFTGGSAIGSYTATSSPGGFNAAGAASPLTVTGLTPGTAYTFTVTAANAGGTGPASAPSNSVIPVGQILALETFDEITAPGLPSGWMSNVGIGSGGMWSTHAGTRFPGGSAAHSGANLAFFNGHSLVSYASAHLATPGFSLTGVSGAKASFWMFRDAAFNSDQVEIRVNTTPWLNTGAAVASSTLLGTVPRFTGYSPSSPPVGTPQAGWYHFVYDIPPAYAGATNYLIFSGYSSGGSSDHHLDDIVVATLPGAPGIGSVAAGVGQTTIAFSPPLSDGGAAISGYIATCTGAATRTGSAAVSPVTVSGLVSGNTYSCSVVATNAVGNGAASSALNAVTALAPAITSANHATFTVDTAGTFSATAIGNPPPAWSLAGALPAGVTFTPASGTLAGTPALGTVASYALTVTAGNGAPPDAQQTFTLVVQKHGQTIEFGSAPTLTAGGSGLIFANPTSGLQAALTSLTPAVCTIVNISVSSLTSGTCTIAADQSGDANYLAAPRATQSFTIGNGPPGPPTHISARPGAGHLQLTFSPPANDGGYPVTDYLATCMPGAEPVAGAASPLIIPALTDGTTVTCSLTASNQVGQSPASDSVVATPGSATAPFAFIPDGGMGNVAVVDLTHRKVVATLAVGASPLGVALDPAGRHAYVTNSGGDTVSVIDTASFAVTSVTVGDQPYGIAIDPAGTQAYVTRRSDNRVAIIDLATGNTTSIAVGAAPSGVVFHPSGRYAYVANLTDSTVTVIDTEARAVTATISGDGLSAPFGLAMHPSGDTLYVASFGNDAVLAIDTGTFSITHITVGSEPVAIAFNPAGSYAYVANNGDDTVSVIETACHAVVATVAVGSLPFGLQVDSSGARVYVVNMGSDDISIIDTAGNAVTATLAIGIPAAVPAGLGNFIQPMALSTPGVAVTGNGTSTFGAGVTFTATLSGGTSPGGSIDFKAGAGSIAGCAAQVIAANVATCTTATLPLGSTSITAVYSGDAGNAAATSPAVVQVVVAPLNLLAVQSRKTHGAAGDFDLPLDLTQPITGNVTVEPRALGSGHRLVFQFDANVASIGSVTAVNGSGGLIGVAPLTMPGNSVVVTLPAVPDATRVTVSLVNINGDGRTLSASIGFLAGDINGSRVVDTTDLHAAKSHAGQAANSANFVYDVNTSGAINAGDILAIKTRLAHELP